MLKSGKGATTRAPVGANYHQHHHNHHQYHPRLVFNYINGDQDDFDILAESQSSLLRVIHNLKLTSSAQGQEGLILIYPCLSHAFHTSNTICSDPTLFKIYI